MGGNLGTTRTMSGCLLESRWATKAFGRMFRRAVIWKAFASWASVVQAFRLDVRSLRRRFLKFSLRFRVRGVLGEGLWVLLAGSGGTWCVHRLIIGTTGFVHGV